MIEEPLYKCYKCKEELVFEVKVGRRDMCPNCYAYLHCCYNCKFYDPYAHNQCIENQGEFIRDRAEGNFCLYWTFKPSKPQQDDEVKEAKLKLDELFKKPKKGKGEEIKYSPKTEEEAKKRLESLFKKK